jgi:transcriptional regulator with XRE-family HTH domain
MVTGGGVMEDRNSRLEFKLAIIRLGKHQYQIANELGINENRLSQFLCGRRVLPADTIAHLQEILGMEQAGVSA